QTERCAPKNLPDARTARETYEPALEASPVPAAGARHSGLTLCMMRMSMRAVMRGVGGRVMRPLAPRRRMLFDVPVPGVFGRHALLTAPASRAAMIGPPAAPSDKYVEPVTWSPLRPTGAHGNPDIDGAKTTKGRRYDARTRCRRQSPRLHSGPRRRRDGVA